jgi:D-3-phosphoglycerate dehydrogenase
MDEPVNLINSALLAHERGIVLNEIKSNDNQNFKNLISAEFVGEETKKTISGTVFGNEEIRIVMVDGYRIELKPEGSMLLYKNIDKPGMLATVSKVLADENINIAGLSLGRMELGKEAITFISLDETISKTAINKLLSTEGILEIFPVNFQQGK